MSSMSTWPAYRLSNFVIMCSPFRDPAAGARRVCPAAAPGQPPEDSSFRRSSPGRVSSCRSRTNARDKEKAMPVDKSLIGRKGEPVAMHVERGKIREFARAIKDDDPLYFDE